jgi:iron complex outermembrane receptor protein
MFQSPFLSNPNPALPAFLPNGTASTAATQNFNSEAHRNISSFFAEVEIPALKNVSFNVSVRGDKYKDAGDGRYSAQTVNPKFAFRYEPTKGLMFRGSYNTGFRAPSMVELYQNLTEIKTDARFDDPVLCPGGKIQNASGGFSGGTAIANLPPGVTANDVCKPGTASAASPNLGYATQLPNNSTLKEEKSRNYTIGIVFEPIQNLTVTVDHWNMNISGVVSSAPIATILNDPVGFSSLYIRNPDGTLKYVLAIQQNLGGLRADGLDISANYVFPNTAYGRFRTGVDATYIDHWASQIRPGGPWLEQVGEFAPTGTGNFGVDPNFGISGRPQMNYRWKYTATVSWERGPWTAQLSQRYNSHYRDQNLLTRITPGGGVPRDVAAYNQFNFVSTYAGFKNLKLTFGINNLFNVNPPLTNNATYSDGYLLTNADVLGRAYNVKVEYKF